MCVIWVQCQLVSVSHPPIVCPYQSLFAVCVCVLRVLWVLDVHYHIHPIALCMRVRSLKRPRLPFSVLFVPLHPLLSPPPGQRHMGVTQQLNRVEPLATLDLKRACQANVTR